MRRRTAIFVALTLSIGGALVAPVGAGPPAPTVPDPPTNPAATWIDCGAPAILYNLSWEPPVFDGGSPITGYTVYSGPLVDAQLGPDTLTYGAVGNFFFGSVTASNAVGESEPVMFGSATGPPCPTVTGSTSTTTQPAAAPPAAAARIVEPSFTG